MAESSPFRKMEEEKGKKEEGNSGKDYEREKKREKEKGKLRLAGSKEPAKRIFYFTEYLSHTVPEPTRSTLRSSSSTGPKSRSSMPS